VICGYRQQKLLLFPTCFIPLVKLFFNTITIYKTKHRFQIQPEDNIRCGLTTTDPYFDKPAKQTNSEIRFSLKFVNLDDKTNLLKLMFVV